MHVLETEPRPAEFWRRALAKVADLSLLTMPTCGLLWLALIAHDADFVSPAFGRRVIAGTLLLGLAYFGFLTGGGRQTPGQRMAGLRAVALNGAPMGLGRSLWRAALALLFLAALPVGVGLLAFLPIAFTKERRALHD